MTIRSYRDLIAWQRAMDVAQLVYQVSAACPKEELFGIVSQMRRSAVSVPSNIAEGQGRKSTKDFLRFLSIAYGSLCEMETQVTLGGRLGFLDESHVTQVLDASAEVGRLVNGLYHSLQPVATDDSRSGPSRTKDSADY
jgi:four helix bundle protein